LARHGTLTATEPSIKAISFDNNPWWLEPTPRKRFVFYYRYLRLYFSLPALEAWDLAKASFGEVPKAREYRRDRSANPGRELATLLVFGLYFAPAIVAECREHHNVTAITALCSAWRIQSAAGRQ